MKKHTYILYHQRIDDKTIRMFFVTKNCKNSWFYNFDFKKYEKEYNEVKAHYCSEYHYIHDILQYGGHHVFVPTNFSFSYFNSLAVRKEF